MQEVHVSIIIVNYKTVNLIIDCIKSIFAQTSGINYEIIVIDNDSKDNCKNILEKEFGDKVKVILSNVNLGFGQANNLGISISKGNAILFLNPDTVIINNAIKILYDFLFGSPKIGAVGGNLYDENYKGTNSYIRFFPGIIYELRKIGYILSIRQLFSKNEDFNTSEVEIPVASITGADLMVKHSILQSIGGFSREYFMYLEETDLCKKIHDLGYKLYSVPTARIQHLEGKSFGLSNHQNFSKKKCIYWEESRRIFSRKHLGLTGRIIYNILYAFRLFLTLIFKGSPQRRYNFYLCFYPNDMLLKKKILFNHDNNIK